MTRYRLAAQEWRGPGGDKPETVRVRLLGGFGVWVGPRAVEAEGRRKAGSLIKMLALAERHEMHRERIQAALWPGLDANHAANNLHKALHFARGMLEPSNAASRYIQLRGGMLSLCPDSPLWVDVETFEEEADAARRVRLPSAYRAAIELYAGELLPGDRYEEWAEERRAHLRRLYVELLVELAGLYEESGEFAAGVEALGKAMDGEPTSEEAHLDLMRLYALAGRREEAARQYGRLERAFGGRPSAAARRLRAEIGAGRLSPEGSRGRRGEEERSLFGRSNLPEARGSFVGRGREMVEVRRSLAMGGLLTLTGAGGVGKTRLALEAAKELVGAYPGGVWLVEFAPLSEGKLAPRAVAVALGAREQPGRPLTQTLSEYIGSGRMLLILDNCEHLVDDAARLAEALLGKCPKLRVLATSREPLGIRGEAVWPVPPLSLPGEGAAIEGLMRSEAVRLFVERARSRLPDFELTEGNSGAVGRVCGKLDGIPLAIELAAARMGALAVEQVAQRLESSLGLLTVGSRTAEPRQRTLRATLDWSHDLLDEGERMLFRRLSVFVGGWALEAAEDVCSREGVERDDVLDLHSRLVDKSLVASLAGGEEGASRYRMLEPVRQYAREKLEDAGEAERVRERHAGQYLALAEEAEAGLAGAGQIAWLARLATEYANVRAALGWFMDEGGAEERARRGLRMAASLGRFWSIRGAEGREWLEEGLGRDIALPRPLRAKALREAGFMCVYHLDPRAIAMLEEALALYKELGDKSGQAATINCLMHAVGLLDYHERAPTLREETEALLAEPMEDKHAAAYLLLTLGMMGMIGDDHKQVARIEEALALFREAGDLRTCAMCLTIAGIDALSHHDEERAGRHFEEALRLLRQLGDKMGILYSLMGAAGVAALQNRPARAARLSGAAEALRNAIGHPVQPLKRVNYDYEAFLATTREALGEAAFEAAFSEGESMSPEQAIEYALSKEEPSRRMGGGGTRQPSRADPLTAREEEVAALVARGLANSRIAEEISVSRRTVDTHVGHILKKLGLRSREQVADRLRERRRHEAG